MQKLTDPAPAVQTTEPIACRFCGSDDGRIVLDLGRQPSSELFPPAEDGRTDPRLSTLLKLCHAFGVSLHELLGIEQRALAQRRP